MSHINNAFVSCFCLVLTHNYGQLQWGEAEWEELKVRNKPTRVKEGSPGVLYNQAACPKRWLNTYMMTPREDAGVKWHSGPAVESNNHGMPNQRENMKV